MDANSRAMAVMLRITEFSKNADPHPGAAGPWMKTGQPGSWFRRIIHVGTAAGNVKAT
jgi:hypothetical protein